MATLDVWLYGRRAGRLENDGSRLVFTYEPDWVANRSPQLSQSLPVGSDPFEGEPVHSFFSNLLPEGEVRRLVARRFGVSAGNDFALLAAIGGDCAGAVSLMEPAETPPAASTETVRWLTEPELAEAVANLPRQPLLADPEDGVRLSLAGAQDKLPVVYRDGRVGVPTDRTPSTHILKAPIPRLDDTVVNEGFCLRLAGTLGMVAAPAEVKRAAGLEFLLVERYDRLVLGETVERVHQEDFCQALGIAPEHKYQSEGGPGMADCAALIRRTVDRPAQDLLRFVDAVTLSFLLGNHDAHGKNYSLLYSSDGTRLAPMYDVVCTVAYPGLSRKMAMKLGGEYRADYVRRRHIERFAAEGGLGAGALRARLIRWAAVVPDVAGNVLQDFRAEGLHRPVLERAMETIERRAAQLEAELRTAATPPKRRTTGGRG